MGWEGVEDKGGEEYGVWVKAEAEVATGGLNKKTAEGEEGGMEETPDSE
jgi:hypothetical protein